MMHDHTHSDAARTSSDPPSFAFDAHEGFFKVQGSTVAIFVAGHDASGEVIRRFSLGTVQPGFVLPGLKGVFSGKNLHLVGVCSPGASITQADGGVGIEEAIEGVEILLSAIHSGPPPPGAIIDVGVESVVSLKAGDVIGAGDHGALFKVVTGKVRLVESQDENATVTAVLLTSGQFVRADSAAELHRVSATDSDATALLISALQTIGLTAAIRGAIKERDTQQEMQDASANKAETSAQRNALRRMATILVPEKHTTAEEKPGEPDVLTAIRIVGEATGIELPKLDRLYQRQWTLSSATITVSEMAGVVAREVDLSDDWWQTDNGPLLATRSSDGAPVALVPHGHTGYDATVITGGVQKVIGRAGPELDHDLDRAAWMFYQPLPSKPVGIMDLFRFCARGLGGDLWTMVGVSFLTALIGLTIPIATGILVGKVLPDGSPDGILGIVAALVVAAVATVIFGVVVGHARIRFEASASMRLMAGLVFRTLSLPRPFIHQYSSGDLTQRIMSIEGLRRTISSIVVSSLLHAMSVVVFLGLIIYYSWMMALVGIAIVAVVLVIMTIMTLLQLKYVRIVQHTTGLLEGLTNQLITGIRVLRANRAEARLFAHWVALFTRQRQAGFRDRTLGNLLSLMKVTVLGGAGVLAVWLVASGHAGIDSAGEYMAFASAFGAYLGALFGLGGSITPLIRLRPIYERLQPILRAVPEGTGGIDPGDLHGHIQLNHVIFAYEEGGRCVLSDVNLLIEPGQFVAIVGASGCGKSTLLSLLLGFETPQSGEVLFDGKPMSDLDPRAVRRQIGTCLQDGDLIPGDIRSNILGATDLGLEAAWKASSQVDLDQDIRALPMGMFTFVNNQVASPSQRQRILLARAVVGSPSILILDEATSHLDTDVQKMIQDNIDCLGMTRIVVAHRLSTIKHADVIHVMQGGTFVQSGNYETLSTTPGPFMDLMERQQR